MPFLLLLCLSLACLPVDWPQPLAGLRPIHSLLGTTGLVAMLGGSAGWFAWRTRQRLQRAEQREGIMRYYGQRRMLHSLSLMAIYVLILYGLGWGWAVQATAKTWLADRLPPGTELAILAPLLVGLVLSWFFFYDAEQALHSDAGEKSRPYGGRLRYVGFQIRQNLALIAAPIVVLIVAQGLMRQFPRTFEDERTQTFFIVPMAGSMVVFMPWVVRLLLRLEPMPAGPLRDRLEAAAVRMHCRCSDILIWNTRNGMANAMVVGVLPWLRYVLLSDKLVEEMTPEEVEAVFGHEVGHVKHNHMLYYLAFLIGSLAVLSRGSALLEAQVRQQWPAAEAFMEAHASFLQSWLALPTLLGLAVYIFTMFGLLSRRCERQADIYGCRAVSCPHPECCGHSEQTALAEDAGGLCPTGIRIFMSALEKVASLNGISRSKPGWLHCWQHSTIERRVSFLERMIGDSALEARFQRRLFWFKVTVLALIVVALGLLWAPDALRWIG
ncbi:MAG TPA: M48 family metallopeptidase [Gemmataceae bacterium]|jgi:Zn-dependent protease with chaperone function|nr:M48 family metallopeptidase [Gemmataceae bacterium]